MAQQARSSNVGSSASATAFILALDVGASRIGIAVAHPIARLPKPLTTIKNDDNAYDMLTWLIQKQEVGEVIVGLPRNLDGDDTPQTKTVRDFADKLALLTPVPIKLQDEALTSVKAEEELRRRGKPYTKGDIDALAAAYILGDYLG